MTAQRHASREGELRVDAIIAAVIAILLAAMTESLGDWALWTALVFAAAFTFMLGRISSIAADHAERQRHSAWLAAVEGPRSRRGWYR